jgi:hypothetical protein
MTDARPKRRSRDEAAAYIRERHQIRCTAGYLAKLASLGGGPVFHRVNGRWAYYLEEDLDTWAQGRISRPLRKASDLPVSAHAA